MYMYMYMYVWYTAILSELYSYHAVNFVWLLSVCYASSLRKRERLRDSECADLATGWPLVPEI